MRPFALLAAVELLVFGVFSPRLGFYHDDWANLERLANAGGFWSGIKYYANVTLERPLSMIEYPLLFAAGGMHPLRYQLFYLGAETLEGWLLYLLLSRLLEWDALALLASALILIFPTHAVTHVWFSSAGMIITVNLVLASLVFHERWTRGRRGRDLALSQLFYLLSVFNYEIAAFLPLLLGGGLWARRRLGGQGIIDGFVQLLREFWFFPASLAVALAWERGVVSLMLKKNPRLMGFSAAHAVKVYLAGLECLANRATDVCARMSPVAWKGLGAGGLLAALAFAAVWAVLLSRAEAPAPEKARRALWTAGGACAGAFIGACAPYAASVDYMPMVYGVMSRTNGVISIAAGLLWAVLIAAAALRWRKAACAVLCAAVCAFTFADWGYSLQWVASWRLQNEIMARMVSRTAGLKSERPGGEPMVLLAGFPISIEPGGALVFGAHWDTGAMLRLRSNRKDISADVVPPGIRYGPEKVDLVFDAATIRSYPYDDLYLYDYGKDELWRLEGPDRRVPPAAR